MTLTNDLKAEVFSAPLQIEQYFDSFNRNAFEETSQLFAAEGEIVPPFGQPVLGQEAIASYLNEEASGMTALPKDCVPISSREPQLEFEVVGVVQTTVFQVNVRWIFRMNAHHQIQQVSIKLLASLKELFALRPNHN